MKHNSGFIALTSTIILSAILMTNAGSVSLSGFFNRFDLLVSEFKARSLTLAEACVSRALLSLGTNPAYLGDVTLAVGDDSCTILPIEVSGGRDVIKVRASYQNADTFLKVIVDSSTLGTVSWEEVPSF